MGSKSIIVIVILVLIILGSAGGYLYLSQKDKPAPTPSPSIQPERTLSPTLQPQARPTQPPPESNIPANWQTYTNTTYGFEISFPENYQALDDSENLYGWPNGVVLIYGGGQSYNIAIEVWDSQSEYQSKYPNEQPAVEQVGNKHLTISDVTQDEVNSEIISTFKLTN